MTDFKYLGTLPLGDWRFGLVKIEGKPDVLVLIDKTGFEEPRVLKGDKLVKIK